MTILKDNYKGYQIYREANNKRIFVSGSGISCLHYWYNINKAKEHIDFILKFNLLPRIMFKGLE